MTTKEKEQTSNNSNNQAKDNNKKPSLADWASEDYLTSSQVEQLLDITKKTLHSYILKGYLKATKMGNPKTGHYRIQVRDIKVFLNDDS
jgi:7-keto-8-aminopelargonate synthetase-like enzyme